MDLSGKDPNRQEGVVFFSKDPIAMPQPKLYIHSARRFLSPANNLIYKLMLEFEVKAVVNDPESLEKDSTVYLFNKEQGILLPIKMHTLAAGYILDAHAKPMEPRPHVHNTILRIITALKAQVDSVLIYSYQDKIFYSYIRLRRETEFMDIDARPSDAISIALRHKVPVFVKDEVYASEGIKVTKELLKSYI